MFLSLKFECIIHRDFTSYSTSSNPYTHCTSWDITCIFHGHGFLAMILLIYLVTTAPPITPTHMDGARVLHTDSLTEAHILYWDTSCKLYSTGCDSHWDFARPKAEWNLNANHIVRDITCIFRGCCLSLLHHRWNVTPTHCQRNIQFISDTRISHWYAGSVVWIVEDADLECDVMLIIINKSINAVIWSVSHLHSQKSWLVKSQDLTS